MKRCPACNSANVEHLFDLGYQPLSLLSLSDNSDDSYLTWKRRIDMIICRRCRHVFNHLYSDMDLPYNEEGCRMYNNGINWQQHVKETQNELNTILNHVGIETVIEIGAGDCEFLSNLETDAIKIAVDPCEAVERAKELGIKYYREYFDTDKHMFCGSKGTLVIMRHLLEHITNIRDFLENIVVKAERMDASTIFFIEVPCCQEALINTRVEDWTYEHPHHFNVESMMALLNSCGFKHYSVNTAYGGEVIKMFAEVHPKEKHGWQVDEVVRNYSNIASNIINTAKWLNETEGVVLWGGAGKSAMFLNLFRQDEHSIVVDSDENKVGFYVPGTRIKIQSTDILFDWPDCTIVSTTSWRANDIRDEIIARGIPCKKLMKFYRGKLVEVPLGN